MTAILTRCIHPSGCADVRHRSGGVGGGGLARRRCGRGKLFVLPTPGAHPPPAIVGGDTVRPDIGFSQRGFADAVLAEETWATPGKPLEVVQRDIERDKILSAAEAKEYGLIDEVLLSRKASLDA